MNFRLLEDIARGKKTRNGLWIHRGINMSDRTIHRVITALLRKRYLLRQHWRDTGTFQYAINIDCELFDGYEDNISIDNYFEEGEEEQSPRPERDLMGTYVHRSPQNRANN